MSQKETIQKHEGQNDPVNPDEVFFDNIKKASPYVTEAISYVLGAILIDTAFSDGLSERESIKIVALGIVSIINGIAQHQDRHDTNQPTRL